MNKIKILYIITKADVGGAQKYVADLTENLDQARFNPKILYGGKDIFWLSNKVHPWFLFVNDWLAIFELVKIFKKENPDVIHFNSSKAGVLGSLAAQLYRIMNNESGITHPKVIFTAHGWVFNPTNQLNPFVRFFYIALHKLCAYFQDDIICVSEYDHQLASRYGIKPAGKLHTIHNGIDSDLKFINKAQARKKIISKLKVESRKLSFGEGSASGGKVNDIWIGSIGRLVKEKNYETYISAAAYLTERQRNGRTEERKDGGTEGRKGKTKELIPYFFLIGEGPEFEKLKVLSSKLKVDDRFFFINPTGDDAKYLKAFDIFVMSSIKEGLPYTLLEAMTAELPIVVTEAGGIPELIKNHQNGMMVSQKNPEQLGKAISGLLANKPIAEELGKSARLVATEHFNIKKMIKKTENIYADVVIETSPIL